MTEVFKDIDGFPKYQVSNLGRVRSTKNNKTTYLSSSRKGYTKSGRYPKVTLYRDGVGHTINVHVLVAQAFVYNDDPDNKTIVNHIDEDKSNNVCTNLEWCTYLYNNNYRNRKRKAGANISQTLVLSNKTNRVFAYKGGTYIFFSSAEQCAKYFGKNSLLVMRIALHNAGRKTQNVRATSIDGYLLYITETINYFDTTIIPVEPMKFKKGKIVAIRGNARLTFNSVAEAEQSNIGPKHSAISNSLKTGKSTKGWSFHYLEEEQ